MSIPARQQANPFPGLRPFRGDEHHLFFGREDQTAALLQLLRQNRFLAVVGTSGSGKSSLVRAGLIAGLHSGTMTQAGSAWEVVLLRPGGSPIENLARGLVEADLYDAEDPHSLPRLSATLNRSRYGLVEAIKQSDVFEDDANLLVVVDQFEELFRFRQQSVGSEETAAAFVNLLLTASQQSERPIYVTITMRSDYLGDCSEIPGLAEAVNDGEYLIPRLMRDQKRAAIEKPIGVGGAQISPLLVQRLLNDVGDDPDQLPVLQHALMRMWSVWEASGEPDRPIDFCDFEAIGGLAAALSNHADEIFDALPDDKHRLACERIFRTLTEKGTDNRGIRRPMRLDQLQAIAEADRETIMTVLAAFRQPGVTFLMPGIDVELQDKTILDLSHESLMRGWQRLRGWVEDEAQSARIFRRLLDTARLWQSGRAGLFRDPDLQIALSWREHQQPNAEWAQQYGGDFTTAIEFLERSGAEAAAEEQAREAARQRELQQAQQLAQARQERLEQQQRAARKLRMSMIGVAAVAVLAAAACVIAIFAHNEAKRLAEVAGAEADRARESAAEAEQARLETATALEEVEQKRAEVSAEKDRAERNLEQAQINQAKAEAADRRSRQLLYATDMQLASMVWLDDKSTADKLREQLAAHRVDPQADPEDQQEDQRGFEWYYFQHLVNRSADIISGHRFPIAATALTADGHLVTLDSQSQLHRRRSTASEDQTLQVDLRQGRKVLARALSADGQVAAIAAGQSVLLFNTASGKLIKQLPADAVEFGVCLSADASMLVTVSSRIVWWNVESGGFIASTNCPKPLRPGVIALSGDGLTLAVGKHGTQGELLTVFRLDRKANRITTVQTLNPFEVMLRSVALNNSGTRVAASQFFTGSVQVLDTATGEKIGAGSAAHAAAISALAFNPVGTRLVTGGLDGTIKVWADVEQLQAAELTFKGHTGPIHNLLFDEGETRLVSGGEDQTARIWDLEQPGVIRALESERSRGTRAAFSPDGLLIAGEEKNQLVIWDATTNKRVMALEKDPSAQVYGVAFSPDNRTLAVGYGASRVVSHVVLWDLDRGERLARLAGTSDLPDFTTNLIDGPANALAFSPDGQYLAAGFGSPHLFRLNNTQGPAIPVKVWNVETQELVAVLNGHFGQCVSVTFSEDGSLLATGSHDRTARIWDTETWRLRHVLECPGQQVLDVAFSPDRRFLAMADYAGEIHIWDVESGERLQTLRGHSNVVAAVAFSRDGRTLASASFDETVRLWNTATWRELTRLDPGSTLLDKIAGLTFSPDGTRLLSAGGMLAYWATQPPRWEDAETAANTLADLLDSEVDFRHRIRLISENLDLHESLAILAQRRPEDAQVAAAYSAALANWHASGHRWADAATAFDKLLETEPQQPEAWLLTHGLMRVATALTHQDRYTEAASLLAGGTRRRAEDQVTAASRQSLFGFTYEQHQGSAIVRTIIAGSPADRTPLRVGDVIVKIADQATDSMEFGQVKESQKFAQIQQLLSNDATDEVTLTVQHVANAQRETITLARGDSIVDPMAGDLLHPLLEMIQQRLDADPTNTGLLELRAELAGHWAGFDAQVADYTAAINALPEEPSPEADETVKRLHLRRGEAHFALESWQPAVADYEIGITDETANQQLFEHQAWAQAEALVSELEFDWIPLKTLSTTGVRGSNLRPQTDGSIRVSGPNPAYESYIIRTAANPGPLAALLLEALPDAAAPHGGVGRGPNGSVALTHLEVALISQPGQPGKPIGLKSAKTDFPDQQRAADAIDGNRDTYWHVYPDFLNPHQLVVFPNQPIEVPENAEFEIRFQFYNRQYAQHGFSRFRLSTATDAAAWERSPRPDPMQIAALRSTDHWTRLAAAYHCAGNQDAIDKLLKRHPESALAIGDLFMQIENWNRAIDVLSESIDAESVDVQLLTKRAQSHERLLNWQAASDDWARVTENNPNGAQLASEFAQRLNDSNQPELARVHFEAARRQYTTDLEQQPHSAQLAEKLAQVILELYALQTQWAVLEPHSLESSGGAQLSKLADMSVLASGDNPNGDTYTIVGSVPPGNISAMRLEALTHDSLPRQGPGRDQDRDLGNFAIVWLEVDAIDSASETRPIELSQVVADFAHLNLSVRSWNTGGHGGEPHTAFYTLAEPFEVESDSQLKLQIRFSDNTNYPKQNLGRFRISFSSDAQAFAHAEQRFEAMRTGNAWGKLALAYQLLGDQTALSRLLETHPSAIGDRYAELEQWDQAIGEYSLRFNPESPNVDLLANRATAYFKTGQTQLAQDDLWTAVRHSYGDRQSELVTQLSDLVLNEFFKPLVPTSEFAPVQWRFNLLRPAANWTQPDFDDSEWPSGPAVFGSNLNVARTQWRTRQISLRHNFELTTPVPDAAFLLRISHDDGAVVFLNGHQIAQFSNWSPDYHRFAIETSLTELLRPGRNTLAVQCTNTGGVGRIDAGLYYASGENVNLQAVATATQIQGPFARLAAALEVADQQQRLQELLELAPRSATGLGDLYADKQDWDTAITGYSRGISAETATTQLLEKRAAAYIATEQWSLAKADWDRVIQQQPNRLQQALVSFQQVERWAEAIDYGWKIIEREPDERLHWLRLAPMLVLVGDDEGYREFCGRTIEHFEASTEGPVVDVVCKSCLLKPGFVELSSLPVDVMTRILEDTTPPEYLLPWYWSGQALVAYRGADPALAIDYATQALGGNPHPAAEALSFAVRALAQCELGQIDQAQSDHDQAAEVIARLRDEWANPGHHDLLIAQIILAEANAKLAQRN